VLHVGGWKAALSRRRSSFGGGRLSAEKEHGTVVRDDTQKELGLERSGKIDGAAAQNFLMNRDV
jgi:hypothetical protein